MLDDSETRAAAASTTNYSIPNIILKSAMPGNTGLKMCRINIRSLLGKMDVVRSTVHGIGVHILMISEPWLSHQITDMCLGRGDHLIMGVDWGGEGDVGRPTSRGPK